MRKPVLILIVAFSTQFGLAQSPWTKQKGKAYVQLGVSTLFDNKAEIDGISTTYQIITLMLRHKYMVNMA